MANSKIQQLLEQKKKLEEQLQAETEKRFIQIGKKAQKYGLMEWSNKAFDNLFKMAKDKGESAFVSSND